MVSKLTLPLTLFYTGLIGKTKQKTFGPSFGFDLQ